MADVTIKTEDEFDVAGKGAFKLARDGLGISSWGMQIVQLPPHADGYPNHDHAADGQEECYYCLAGSAELQCDGESFELAPGTFARIGAEQKRKIVPGDDGFKMLALGGVPGQAYEAPDFSRPQRNGD